MRKFIEMTGYDDGKLNCVFINKIICFWSAENLTDIMLGEETILRVKESYETVKQLILEAGK